MVEKEKGMLIKVLRYDGGGEYFLDEFNDYLKEQGILRKYSCKSTPQHNGIAKRKKMHIVEVTRAILNEKKIPGYFWTKAVATTMYIVNRTPTAAVHGMSSDEKYIGRKPYISHLKIFGCIAYVHVSDDERRTKLDPKAKKCSFIGYSL